MRYGLKFFGTVVLVLAGLLMAGCEKPKPPAAAVAPEVGVFSVTTEKVLLTTELPGRTNARLVAEIRPQVAGLLLERLFDEGADVKKGDILYRIDPAQYQATYDQAVASLKLSEAQIALAEANLPALKSRAKRLRELVAIKAAGEQDADDADAAVRQAEANLAVSRSAVEVNRAAVAAAAINLSYTPIKAPISGRIGRSDVTVGSMVTAYQGAPLAVIQQLDPIYVDVTQSSASLLALRRSLENGELRQENRAKVHLLLEDGSEYKYTGTMKFQDITVEQSTGSVSVRVEFPNPDHILLPGMFVRAVVEEGIVDNAMMVPQSGVSRDTRGEAVALLVDAEGKVSQSVLKVDRAIGNRWLVLHGLKVGDKVIVEGSQNQSVRPGATVRVASAGQPGASSPAAAK